MFEKMLFLLSFWGRQFNTSVKIPGFRVIVKRGTSALKKQNSAKCFCVLNSLK